MQVIHATRFSFKFQVGERPVDRPERGGNHFPPENNQSASQKRSAIPASFDSSREKAAAEAAAVRAKRVRSSPEQQVKVDFLCSEALFS